MRKHPLITGQYYHLYNRGVDKRDIFTNKEDMLRFVLSVKEFNTIKPTGSIKELLEYKSDIQRTRTTEDEKPLISIVCYCFNPNHFHFIVKQEVDGGISEFSKRLLGGYTNYFNKTYDRSGALFQGRFKSHLLENSQYVLKIYPYVNVNYLIHDIPREKSHLVFASDKEYESMKFDLVSPKEAKELLGFYGDNNNTFNNECLKIVPIIRAERGKVTLLDEDELPII
jgi:putative transposase